MSDRAALPESELLVRCQEGEREALTELVSRHKRPIYLLALRFTRNREDARDITQEAFLKALEHIDRIEPGRGIRSWLYKVVTNLCMNHFRSGKRQKRSYHALLDNPPEACPEAEDVLLRRRLESALDDLEPRLRAALTLVCLQGLTHREAGLVLGCSEGTISWRIFKAKESLRRKLKPVMKELR